MADRSALARATESTESPTPGYLYIDIAKSVSVSPVAAKDTIKFLLRRLQNKSHNVKFKALKVIGKTAEKGGLFKREILCNNEAMGAIKAYLNYSGPPDPVRGDEPYNKIRTAAKDCLDMIYSDNPKSEATFVGGGMSSMGSGMGSAGSGAFSGGSSGGYNGSMGSSGGGGGGGGVMEGIGNPMYNDPRLDQSKGMGNMTVGEVASTFGETIVGMIKDPLAKGIEKGIVPSRFAPPGSAELSQRTGGEWNMATNRGPNAIDPNRNYNNSRGPNAIDPNRNYNRERDGTYYMAKDTSASAFQWAQGSSGAANNPVRGGVGGSWAQSSVASQAKASAHNGSLPPMGNVGAAASDGTYEKNLIQELCPPGGLKAEPPPDKLASFASSLSSLDPDLVCPALLDCLEDGQPWIMKAKALCVMETTLKVSTGASNPYAGFFHTCLAEVEPLVSHSRQAVRDPAKRVLTLLGIQSAPSQQMPSAPPPPPPQQQPFAPTQKQPAAPPPAPPQPVADLLDFGDDEAASAPPLPPVQDSLFGGLEVRANEPSAPPPSTAPPVAAPPPVEQPPLSDSASSMFADLSIKENVLSAPSVSEPPAAPAPSGFSFLNNTAPEPTPTPEPAMDTSNASNGNVPTPAPTTPAPTTPAPSKAYDELLNLSIAPPQTIETPKQTPKTFDPLLNPAQAPISPNKMLQQQIQQPMMMPQYNYNPNYIQMQIAMQAQMNAQMNAAGRMGGMSQPPMPSPLQTQSKNIMIGAGNAARQSNISFINDESNKKKEQQLKTFDFVKDAMKNAK